MLALLLGVNFLAGWYRAREHSKWAAISQAREEVRLHARMAIAYLAFGALGYVPFGATRAAAWVSDLWSKAELPSPFEDRMSLLESGHHPDVGAVSAAGEPPGEGEA